jgi:salicylate hydroxylase
VHAAKSSSNEVHNFVAIFHNDDAASMKSEDWHAPVDKSKVLETFSDFHQDVLAVLE